MQPAIGFLDQQQRAAILEIAFFSIKIGLPGG